MSIWKLDSKGAVEETTLPLALREQARIARKPIWACVLEPSTRRGKASLEWGAFLGKRGKPIPADGLRPGIRLALGAGKGGQKWYGLVAEAGPGWVRVDECASFSACAEGETCEDAAGAAALQAGVEARRDRDDARAVPLTEDEAAMLAHCAGLAPESDHGARADPGAPQASLPPAAPPAGPGPSLEDLARTITEGMSALFEAVHALVQATARIPAAPVEDAIPF